MNWIRARLQEPSTWCALGIACLAVGIWLSTQVSWWRDFIYIAAAVSVAGTLLKEKAK